MFRFITIILLLAIFFFIWDDSKASQAATGLSVAANSLAQDIEGASNDGNKDDSSDNSLSTRDKLDDKVAYIDRSIIKLKASVARLEERLFEQQVLITKTERQKKLDGFLLNRNNQNLSVWKEGYYSNNLPNEKVPFTKAQVTTLIKDTFERNIQLQKRPQIYETLLINGKGYEIELTKALEKLDSEITRLQMDRSMVQILDSSQGFYEIRNTVNVILDESNTLINDYAGNLNLDAAINVQQEVTDNLNFNIDNILSQID
jgi:hypothetical protein